MEVIGGETTDYDVTLFQDYTFRVYTSDGKEVKVKLSENERDKLAASVVNNDTYYGLDTKYRRVVIDGAKVYHVEMLRGWVNGPVKQCKTCLATKPLDEFKRHKSTKDGRTARCLPCEHRAYRVYYEANREKVNERNNRWKKTPRGREYMRQRSREWAKENPDAVRALCRRRSKRMRDARKVPYLDSDIFNRDNWVCQLCDKPIDPNAEYRNDDGSVNLEYKSIDHVIPISKGGADAPDNVQAAHLGCNIAKGARFDNDNDISHA